MSKKITLSVDECLEKMEFLIKIGAENELDKAFEFLALEESLRLDDLRKFDEIKNAFAIVSAAKAIGIKAEFFRFIEAWKNSQGKMR